MAPKAEDAKKRKAAKAEDEPAAKRDCKEDDVEKDAPPDSRPVTKAAVSFHGIDTTLNVVPAMQGKVLMALTEGGMQYLVAGARASVGMKAGRYMYEVKIIEALNPVESTQGIHGRTPQPRQLVRLGFSAAGSSLVLGESDECAYFDSEGNFGSGKLKKRTSQNFTRDQVITVILNLDPKSSNAYTMSLFREGARIAEPQPIPQCLRDKPLYPHICFRNVTVQVNMGPQVLRSLPFTCRMLQSAAAADVVESKEPGGIFNVMLPVAVPDEGTFDWLDDWLEENPSWVELSDRKLQQWAASSGLAKPKGGSLDKPSFSYGIGTLEDLSLQKVINSIAATIPRNYVVMEVRGNLVAEERAEVLKRFSLPHFKKSAMVVMGKPLEEFKDRLRAKILKEKQSKSDNEWKLKKAQRDQAKQMARRQKELAEMRRKAEESRKKLLEEALKKAGDESKKEEVKGENAEDAKDEPKAEVKEEEVKQEEDDDGMGEEPPKVELTEEELNVEFRPKAAGSDIAPGALSKSIANFTVPEESEGFDAVEFVWEGEAESKEYLKKWIMEAKQTMRIEDLQPSKYFADKVAQWQKLFQDWQAKQKTFKANPPAKKEKKDTDEPERKVLDIFSIEDVDDMGDGEPLYANFAAEDWALLQMRYEFYLLQECFKKDVDDPDRLDIPEVHISFYFTKYFKKTLNPQAFSLKTVNDLVDLIKDTVIISGDPAVLTANMENVDSPEIFVKFTEECRRDRQRRSDAGDETAKLKYAAPSAPAIRPQAPIQSWPQIRPPAGFKAPGKGAAPVGTWKGGKW
ncbi:unnamed protein product [Effrenium voratum]|nr:unnamed protein product [Effrenium voratum]